MFPTFRPCAIIRERKVDLPVARVLHLSHSLSVFRYLHRLESPVSQGRTAEEQKYVTGDNRQVRVMSATRSSITWTQVSERHHDPFCISYPKNMFFSLNFIFCRHISYRRRISIIQVDFVRFLVVCIDKDHRNGKVFFAVKTPSFTEEPPWI